MWMENGLHLKACHRSDEALAKSPEMCHDGNIAHILMKGSVISLSWSSPGTQTENYKNW